MPSVGGEPVKAEGREALRRASGEGGGGGRGAFQVASPTHFPCSPYTVVDVVVAVVMAVTGHPMNIVQVAQGKRRRVGDETHLMAEERESTVRAKKAKRAAKTSRKCNMMMDNTFGVWRNKFSSIGP